PQNENHDFASLSYWENLGLNSPEAYQLKVKVVILLESTAWALREILNEKFLSKLKNQKNISSHNDKINTVLLSLLTKSIIDSTRG
ncbi:MAG: hypothetical protein PHP74_04670, partial [Candidatus Gracilibacteria bacterium]|nr:hypothetical protein [Candidatus Gracilibacteria bacterium]